MTRIAILGGGISGLTAAYELELARRAGAPIDWHLYEANGRLGGIIETTRHTTPEGEFILEGGPDAWVSEKPWARDLAIELGLESDLIYSNDATRRTYIWQQDGNSGEIPGQLQPIPDRMRLMVPEDLATLENSPLFSDTARAAYASELASAAQLQSASPFVDPTHDESVATFVLRHFGKEVLTKLAAPLLSGVFGGDVAKLSARAVMPQFIAMERDHGSLIAALQTRAKQRGIAPPQPIFTSLRNGMASLVDAIVASLPADRVHLRCTVEYTFDEVQGKLNLPWDQGRWSITVDDPSFRPHDHPKALWVDWFDHVIIALPLDVVRSNLPTGDLSVAIRPLLPTQASSAVLATFCWPAGLARTFTIPPGFGFLVPQSSPSPVISTGAQRSGETPAFVQPPPHIETTAPQLFACTFVGQKFPHRAPPGARILRAFFGGPAAKALIAQPDEVIAAAALTQLRQILGPLPAPDASLTTIRRLPRSLPQYEVGHLNRMAQLDALISQTPGRHLLGNSYRGVGLPDLIRDARAAARRIAQRATGATPD